MKEIVEKALARIRKMSKDQFLERMELARGSQIAIALRDLQEMSDWSFSENHILEKFLVVITSATDTKEVKYEQSKEYNFECAANDERFALAA